MPFFKNKNDEDNPFFYPYFTYLYSILHIYTNF